MTDLTRDELAVLYVDSLRVMGALEAACVDQARSGSPLPRGMLTCGEAVTLLPAIARLCLLIDPELADPDVLEQAFRAALARSAIGVLN